MIIEQGEVEHLLDWRKVGKPNHPGPYRSFPTLRKWSRPTEKRMHSKWSEYSHRWPSDRSSRQWDDYNDRREERHDSLRDAPRDSFQKYRGDGHSSTEKTGRGGEYDSPKRQYSTDSLNRDWSRKSPLRRRMSSPVRDASERKRQRFTGDDDNDYRYRHESLEKPYRLSPDNFSHEHKTKDLKCAPPQEDDFKYRKTYPDSRYRHHREEFPYRKHDDSSGRSFIDCYKDRDNHQWKQDSSQERTRSPYRSPESFESDTSQQSAAAPEKKSSKGFQRFLDVLNKGVNIDVLTNIVTQTSAQLDDRDASGHPWSPGCTEWQQKPHQHKGSRRLASPQPLHRSQSPNRHHVSDEQSLQGTDNREGLFSSRKSPSLEKITLTPEDEQKQRQMQDVLQAIGVNLGFEELGQMSHRIRERLYGKEVEHDQKVSRERSTRQTLSLRHQSASSSSSSSRSSISPLTHDSDMKKDPCSSQRDATEVHQTQTQQSSEYGQRMGSIPLLQDHEECKTNPQKNTAAIEVFSPNSTYGVLQPPPAQAMPMYSPMNCSPLPYPAISPAVSLAPPPVLPSVRPGLFLPCLPPFLPRPPVQPPNMFPPVLAQMRHLLPPPITNTQPQLYNPPHVNTVQGLNKTQKSKPQARPRCLQVIK
ncbi:cyclin-dependent kinase 12-like isoform X2 [Melanotaenia boesemani]|uniref:cyclin-dependent kinase 12-like isoform X2 n=1 Tax=Melanotaenia boesemani TaxID=1250792 RepID=UPI001C05076E|nr:cyclin-dependent kinase 12-like isoform X2 [Melanotaenia boesemani]